MFPFALAAVTLASPCATQPRIDVAHALPVLFPVAVVAVSPYFTSVNRMPMAGEATVMHPAWAAVKGDDQQRAATPTEAIAQGADYLVVGRPIRTAPDPVKAAERVIEEIAAGLGVP